MEFKIYVSIILIHAHKIIGCCAMIIYIVFKTLQNVFLLKPIPLNHFQYPLIYFKVVILAIHIILSFLPIVILIYFFFIYLFLLQPLFLLWFTLIFILVIGILMVDTIIKILVVKLLILSI